MNHLNVPFIIVSAEQSNALDYVNACQLDKLRSMIEFLGLPYKRLIGSYKGVCEGSFLVLAPSIVGMQLALEFGQESYLYVDSERQATLVYTLGGGTSLGKFARIRAEELPAFDSWSFDVANNAYYTTLGSK